jgi:thiamine pyrophosphate-dependent acetolactate synthase large subunit-like protein
VAQGNRRASVCLGTLGPGAMNLVTAIGDAFLDRAPLVALTGQADLERMHKKSHQFIDLVELFRPITKWNARVASPQIIPEVVRKAFKVAESEKPGATHLELPEDILISDVGLHKLWIGRMFSAHEPNTVLIANGLAGMGFALPCAVAAKLLHPERKVVTVNGDGGFLMNCQELETAMRLKTPFVSVVWENRQ